MFKNIISIIGSRYLVAFLNLLLIFVNGKILGREGMGLVGIIYTTANIAVIFNSILCGNTIVYFMNRYGIRYVFYPAYIWALIGSAIACFSMYLSGFIPERYGFAIFLLAILLSLISANTLILLGKDKIKWFNITSIINGTVMFLLLLFMYFIVGEKNVHGYLVCLFISSLSAYIFSSALLIPFFRQKEEVEQKAPFFSVLKEMFAYGLWSSIDNLAEGLATRLNYFLVQHFGGYANVGLLDSGTKISESVWHISRSISFMEYNSVSKTTDTTEQKRITIQLFKLTYCCLIVVMVTIVCIPEWIYTDYLLTPEFADIRHVIIGLAVGIVALGSNQVLSHYFIGSGKVKYSAFCSMSGLVVLLVAGSILIPRYGVVGAAITSSIAYTAMLTFSIIAFMKQTHARFWELIPSEKDIQILRKKVGANSR